ncbi:MAG: hypothetical protein QM734_04250 [Cyclobacteriaceae bacterium]
MASIKLTTIVVIIGVMMITSCEENNAVKPTSGLSNQSTAGQPGTRILNYTFDGTEGGAIPMSTATSWTQNYVNQNPQAVQSHFFGANSMRKILSTSGCMGIRIYYSLDDSGNKQMVLVGADINGNDILSTAGIKGKTSATSITSTNTMSAVSSADGDAITTQTSKQWIANYGAKYPTSLVAHFFGHEILNQILGENDCIGIRMYYALNNSGVQQILLVGVNSKGQNILPSQINGKETDGGGSVGDMSYPCPSYCPNT